MRELKTCPYGHARARRLKNPLWRAKFLDPGRRASGYKGLLIKGQDQLGAGFDRARFVTEWGIVTSSLISIRNWGLAAAFALWPAAAHAGGGFDFSDLEFQGGGIGVITPKYEGSKSYEARGIPFVLPGSKDGDSDIEFVDLDDVQYRLIKAGPFEAGPLAGVWLGRSKHDGVKLEGLDSIDAGLVLGGYGALRFGYTKFQASYHQQVTSEDRGGLLRLRADAEVPIMARVRLLAGVGANYGTNSYMDLNFGVNPTQAAQSTAKLSVFDPGDGFKDVFVGAGAEIDLTDRWTARLYGEYSRLVGDAADSPLIETKDQFSGLLSISYQFGSHSAAAETSSAPLK